MSQKMWLRYFGYALFAIGIVFGFLFGESEK
jgi:hypothetical protein